MASGVANKVLTTRASTPIIFPNWEYIGTGIMKVTMDRVGRVVVPKWIREQLGLDANTEFDLEVEGSGIRLQPRQTTARQIKEVDGWPVLAAVPGKKLTDADVQGLRDADQR